MNTFKHLFFWIFCIYFQGFACNTYGAKVELAVFCAREYEAEAMSKALEQSSLWDLRREEDFSKLLGIKKNENDGNSSLIVKIFQHNTFHTYLAVAVIGKNIMLSQSSTERLFFLFPDLKHVFLVGIGGGLDPDIPVGTLCMYTKVTSCIGGFDLSQDPISGEITNLRRPPEMENIGSFQPTAMEASIDSTGYSHKIPEIPCFIASGDNLAPKHFEEWQGICSHYNVRPVVGITSPTFIHSPQKRQKLFEIFKAQIVDMESFLVAYTCRDRHCNLTIIRTVSDLAGDHSSEKETIEFNKEAASQTSAEVTILFLEIFAEIYQTTELEFEISLNKRVQFQQNAFMQIIYTNENIPPTNNIFANNYPSQPLQKIIINQPKRSRTPDPLYQSKKHFSSSDLRELNPTS